MTIERASSSTYASVPERLPTTESLKPLTISELQLWHGHLAHIHPTALQSLIDGYTNDDSMCTACIQDKHKQ